MRSHVFLYFFFNMQNSRFFDIINFNFDTILLKPFDILYRCFPMNWIVFRQQIWPLLILALLTYYTMTFLDNFDCLITFFDILYYFL